MLRGFFGNLIFAIIARMLCGNHLNSVHTTGLVLVTRSLHVAELPIFFKISGHRGKVFVPATSLMNLSKLDFNHDILVAGTNPMNFCLCNRDVSNLFVRLVPTTKIKSTDQKPKQSVTGKSSFA